MSEELIKITQLPIIEEHLRSLKDQVEQETAEALALVCNVDTLATVKQARAELSKKLAYMEEQRKAVKKAIMGPYESFEAVYKECISGPFKDADASLKAKINDTENGIKQQAEDEMREFFAELAQAHHVEWLTYDRMGLNISMADAKQKTYKRLREEITAFITGVSDAVESISQMDGADEIMAEFKDCLSLAVATGRVFDRHRRIAEEREAQEARQKQQEAEKEAAAKVQAVYEEEKPLQAPVEAPEPTPAPKVYRMEFTVHGTIDQLKALKNFMIKEGIRYE